jgi:plasmid stabilization system protein ParE
MTPSLLLRAEAKVDIREAYDWYEERRPGLGKEFLGAVRKTLKEVESAPLRFRRARGGIRRAPLHRFPYAIFFIPEGEVTVVIACFHARRDPARLHDRFS